MAAVGRSEGLEEVTGLAALAERKSGLGQQVERLIGGYACRTVWSSNLAG